MPPVMVPQIVLPQSCATCFHFDGEGFCTLPEQHRPFRGKTYVVAPTRMVCDQHVLPEQEDGR